MKILISERLILKPLEDKDIEMIRIWRNTYKQAFFDSSEITPEKQGKWYNDYKASDGKDQIFIITLSEDNTPIGQVSIYNINNETRTGTFGRFLLLETYRHRGYGEEAIKRLLQYCFEDLQLYKVRTEVYYDNIDAIAVYSRARFKPVTRPIIWLEKVNDNYKEKNTA